MEKELLYRFFRCETTTEQEKSIMDWLDADPANHDQFNTEREFFNSVVLHAPDNGSVEKRRGHGERHVLSRIAKYAAAAAAVVLLVMSVGYFAKEGAYKDLARETNTITVPGGQRINITLQDGTSVWLNAETEIEYPLVFNKTRRVRINGEALFEVAHDAARPFIVETFACDVEVLGTKFNIAADKETGSFSTALMNGSVKVTNRNRGNEDMVLRPDEKASLVGGYLYRQSIDDPDEYRWPEGLVSLKSRSFAELMDKFEKYYGVKIIIERKTVPQVKYAGKVRVSDGIDHALRILQRASEFTYVKNEEANEIYIR